MHTNDSYDSPYDWILQGVTPSSRNSPGVAVCKRLSQGQEYGPSYDCAGLIIREESSANPKAAQMRMVWLVRLLRQQNGEMMTDELG